MEECYMFGIMRYTKQTRKVMRYNRMEECREREADGNDYKK